MREYVERLTPNDLAIFLFHGVVESSDSPVRNYTKKHLERDFFEKLIAALKSEGNALSLDQVIEHHSNHTPYPPRAFAITFDDGFENNYSIAAPVLRKFGVPATFYVSTHLVEHNSMSWIDRIEFGIEKVQSGEIKPPWLGGGVWSFSSSADKIKFLTYLRKHVKADPAIDTDTLVTDIFAQLGLEEVRSSHHPLDQKLSWDQVKALHEDPLFRVGGHSHNHVNLAFLKPAEMENEIDLSLSLLKAKAGITARHYSYPEGLEHCFSPAIIQKLKSSGVACSPTAIDGTNPAGTDLFHLKRIFVV
jgi:peptidoglycan/xylan/chitin deacetylase (PgdA/CDA1 family)